MAAITHPHQPSVPDTEPPVSCFHGTLDCLTSCCYDIGVLIISSLGRLWECISWPFMCLYSLCHTGVIDPKISDSQASGLAFTREDISEQLRVSGGDQTAAEDIFNRLVALQTVVAEKAKIVDLTRLAGVKIENVNGKAWISFIIVATNKARRIPKEEFKVYLDHDRYVFQQLMITIKQKTITLTYVPTDSRPKTPILGSPIILNKETVETPILGKYCREAFPTNSTLVKTIRLVQDLVKLQMPKTTSVTLTTSQSCLTLHASSHSPLLNPNGTLTNNAATICAKYDTSLHVSVKPCDTVDCYKIDIIQKDTPQLRAQL